MWILPLYHAWLVNNFWWADKFADVFLRRKWRWRKPASSVLRLIIVFLVFQMQNIQLLFSLLELTFEPSDLLLIWLFALLKLNLEKGELFHCFLYSLLVFIKHTIGGPVLWLKSFVNIFKFDDFFLEIFEFSLEIVPLPFDELKFFFKDGSLIFFLFLWVRHMLPCRYRFHAEGS